MKKKMDIESSLYVWKIVKWVVPSLLLLISGAIVIYSNFKIHHYEKLIQAEKEIQAENQREKDKGDIISAVDSSANHNKELIETLLDVSDSEQKKRNKIIGELYWYGLSEFLAKFRLVIHCLDRQVPLNDKIVKTFQPSNLGVAPNLSLLTKDMVFNIVMEYDFMKKSSSCDFTSSLFLQDISKNLNTKAKDILDKYAATGNPELIKEIELMANYSDNFIGAFGPWGNQGIWTNSTTKLPKSRKNAARDLNDLIWKLKNDLEICNIYK